MKKKLLFISTVLLVGTFEVFAQQDALFSQYMFNMMLVNPAYTGSRDVLSLSSLYRKQWANVPGAPETITFSVDSPIKNEKMGVGLSVFNDKVGVVSNTGFYANYAYRIRLTNNSTLAMGASLGLTNYRAELTGVQLSDHANAAADNAFSGNPNKILPNLGLGAYYSNDKFYVGFSLPHVLNNKIQNDGGLTSRQYRHSFLMAGYVFNINESFKIKPSALVKHVAGSPLQLDLNTNVWLYDKFGVGVSYRSLAAPVIMAEVQISDQFRFGYAFDYTTSIKPKDSFGRTSHEFLLRYEFGYDRGKVLTPRYF
jgi:type IX secretion system PorP/SprF family membrane protein